MIYTPDSRHIALLDLREKSKNQFGAREVSWFVEAGNQFLRDHLHKLYPEDPIWTIEHYSSITGISLVEVWPMVLADDDGLPDALGHHYNKWGLIGALVDCLNRSLDDIMSTYLHELEMCFNPYLIEWATLPDGRETPREAGDPVQWDLFNFDVSQKFAGVVKTRSFRVQNMVGARYWGELPNEHAVPFDLKGVVTAAHQWPLKGYRVVKDGGRTYNEFGAAIDVNFGAKKFGPLSRTWNLMQKKTPRITREANGLWSANGAAKVSANSVPEALNLYRAALVQKLQH